ncbi:MAG: TetR/AcrR family transcriptional regulator [Bacteriovoracaceae bacterium]|jgi:TetR/AcrR family transcriptional regulator of autoinduction and epiphytic fitness|nr:TetR/AcrR family transcriptional regulator [Bacteriovoracaceae bacterium]
MTSGTKKQDILLASIEIFVNEGFDRPTMDSIATRANVSKRTLYKHYPSKRSLLDSILIHLISNNQKALEFNFKKTDSLKDQLCHIITQKAKSLLEQNNIKLAKIILSEYLKDEGLLKEQIEEVIKNETITIKWIQQNQEAGHINSDQSALDTLEFLNEIINGIIFFPMLFGKKQNYTKNDISNIATMFLAVKEVK